MTPEQLRENPLHHKIEGITYRSTKLPASKGLMILSKLTPVMPDQVIQLLVNSLLPARDGVERPRRLQDMQPEQITAMIGHLIDSLARINTVAIAKLLLAGVQFERMGNPVSLDSEEEFDSHFAGEYEQLFAVLKFAFLHNFAGPTRGSLSKSGSPGTQEAGQTTSPDT
jgi:hypothetical protein